MAFFIAYPCRSRMHCVATIQYQTFLMNVLLLPTAPSSLYPVPLWSSERAICVQFVSLLCVVLISTLFNKKYVRNSKKRRIRMKEAKLPHGALKKETNDKECKMGEKDAKRKRESGSGSRRSLDFVAHYPLSTTYCHLSTTYSFFIFYTFGSLYLCTVSFIYEALLLCCSFSASFAWYACVRA